MFLSPAQMGNKDSCSRAPGKGEARPEGRSAGRREVSQWQSRFHWVLKDEQGFIKQRREKRNSERQCALLLGGIEEWHTVHLGVFTALAIWWW